MQGITLTQINKEIAKRGYDATLVKGDGYFYFIGPAVDNITSTSVYVYKVNQLPLEQWIDELLSLIKGE